MEKYQFGYGCMCLPITEHLKTVVEKFEAGSGFPTRK